MVVEAFILQNFTTSPAVSRLFSVIRAASSFCLLITSEINVLALRKLVFTIQAQLCQMKSPEHVWTADRPVRLHCYYKRWRTGRFSDLLQSRQQQRGRFSPSTVTHTTSTDDTQAWRLPTTNTSQLQFSAQLCSRPVQHFISQVICLSFLLSNPHGCYGSQHAWNPCRQNQTKEDNWLCCCVCLFVRLWCKTLEMLFEQPDCSNGDASVKICRNRLHFWVQSVLVSGCRQICLCRDN